MKKILSFCLIVTTAKTTIAQITNAENGLYKPDATTVRWGGPLTENTTIDLSSSFFFNFSKGTTNYFKIANNGNIGIGSSDPGVSLSLGGSLANSKLAIWEGGDVNGTRYRYGFGIADHQFRFHVDMPDSRFSFLSNEAGSTEIMTIMGNGNVGIGATYPGAPLSFGGSLANTKIALWESGIVNGVRTSYGLGVQSYQFRLHLDAPGARFSFLSDEAGTTELMTIQGTGNVGIGTTNPQAKLAVNGSICATKVTVKSQCWADYVFHPSYSLRPLTGTIHTPAPAFTRSANHR